MSFHTEDPSLELSSRRTGMSFQRTRLSADRTLMSVIRTSLALISFGFTIFQFFSRLEEQGVTKRPHSPRNFGGVLVYIGVAMICVGILFHVQFMRALRRERTEMVADGLIRGESPFPISYTLVIALLLLVFGFAAIASMTFGVGLSG